DADGAGGGVGQVHTGAVGAPGEAVGDGEAIDAPRGEAMGVEAIEAAAVAVASGIHDAAPEATLTVAFAVVGSPVGHGRLEGGDARPEAGGGIEGTDAGDEREEDATAAARGEGSGFLGQRPAPGDAVAMAEERAPFDVDPPE